MKIYECFLYFDEDLLLETRLNILNKFIDKFVIVESKFSHSGKERKPKFDINNFKNFKNKIEYILLEENPKNLYEINDNDEPKNENNANGNLREFYQKKISKGPLKVDDNDLVSLRR